MFYKEKKSKKKDGEAKKRSIFEEVKKKGKPKKLDSKGNPLY